jgi:phage terminase Nu1 subunit (DNA packaging protein)
VSHVAVQRAIKAGRLSQSVVNGRIVDPDLADREWESTTDLSKAPGYVRERADQRAEQEPDVVMSAHEGMSLSEASAVEKIWKAKAAELKFRQEARELVPAKEVENRLTAVFHTCKTRLLGVPSRAKQSLPHLTVADIAALEALVREALEELSSGAVV